MRLKSIRVSGGNQDTFSCTRLVTSCFELQILCTHPSLSRVRTARFHKFAVFPPKVRISDQDPSMDRSFRMLRQINGAIPHNVQGVKENKKQLPSQYSFTEKKDTKRTKTFWGDFRISPSVLEPDPREKRDRTVFWIAS